MRNEDDIEWCVHYNLEGAGCSPLNKTTT